MILVDANLLLYAYNTAAPAHVAAKSWLERELSGAGLLQMAWATILAFIRISTNPRAFPTPLSAAQATGIVSQWLEEPTVGLLVPGERHWSIFSQLLKDAQSTGPLVSDTHLAALAIEHGATLYTTDADFRRFPGLSHKNPL